jgi:hypothetical protein
MPSLAEQVAPSDSGVGTAARIRHASQFLRDLKTPDVGSATGGGVQEAQWVSYFGNWGSWASWGNFNQWGNL